MHIGGSSLDNGAGFIVGLEIQFRVASLWRASCKIACYPAIIGQLKIIIRGTPLVEKQRVVIDSALSHNATSEKISSSWSNVGAGNNKNGAPSLPPSTCDTWISSNWLHACLETLDFFWINCMPGWKLSLEVFIPTALSNTERHAGLVDEALSNTPRCQLTVIVSRKSFRP